MTSKYLIHIVIGITCLLLLLRVPPIPERVTVRRVHHLDSKFETLRLGSNMTDGCMCYFCFRCYLIRPFCNPSLLPHFYPWYDLYHSPFRNLLHCNIGTGPTILYLSVRSPHHPLEKTVHVTGAPSWPVLSVSDVTLTTPLPTLYSHLPRIPV